MAEPTLSISTDRAEYAKGDLITLTAQYADADAETFEVTVTVRNQASGALSAPQAVTIVVDPLETVVADSTGRLWSKVSDDGTTAVYETRA